MSKVYNGVISAVDKFVPVRFQPLWNHPAGTTDTHLPNNIHYYPSFVTFAGPKTVFFWAPAFKWGLVIAGIGDLNRPAEKLSVSQCAILSTTGFIWARYSLVIIPKNYGLFSVNFFLGIVQLRQVYRAYQYQQSLLEKDKK